MADLTNINCTFLASTIHLSLYTALHGIRCTIAVAHTLYSIHCYSLSIFCSYASRRNIFIFQLSMSLCPFGMLYLYSLLQSADATTGSALLLPKVPRCLIFRCIRHKVKLKIPVTGKIYFKPFDADKILYDFSLHKFIEQHSFFFICVRAHCL
jgi:hypothetical protein